MTIADIPIFQVLKQKMQWHEARQGYLAQNIAHADTPNYRAKDLEPLDFKKHLARPSKEQGTTTAVLRTHKAHFTGSPFSASAQSYKVERPTTFETTPQGNNVVLEEEMMKLTANQLDYQSAATLYQKGIALLKTAMA
jgi:flagellar basal-body rod protein FlgB